MKHKIREIGVVALLALSLFEVSSVWASRVVGSIVTGRITALAAEQIVVDGRTYRIKSGSQAAEKKRRLVVGETIDLVLDGPLDGSSNVVDINEHTAP